MTKPPPEPGHADTLKPDQQRLSDAQDGDEIAIGVPQSEMFAQSKQDEMKQTENPQLESGNDDQLNGQEQTHAESSANVDSGKPPTTALSLESDVLGPNESWEPKPPKVFMEDPDATPLELRSQIQHYATNE